MNRRKKGTGSVICRNGQWIAVTPPVQDPITGVICTRRHIPAVKFKREGCSFANTKEGAERVLTTILAEQVRGKWIEPNKLTVEQYFARYLLLTRAHIKPSTYGHYCDQCRTIRKHLGNFRLQELAPEDLTRFYLTWHLGSYPDGRPHALSTVKGLHSFVRTVLKSAVEDGNLGSSPADKARTPREDKRKVSYRPLAWPQEATVQILDALKEHRLYPAYRLMAATGMRIGEVLGVRDNDAHLDDLMPHLDIVWNRVRAAEEEGGLAEGTPKSASSVRRIALDPGTVGVLRQWFAQRAAEQLLAADDWEDDCDLCKGRHVFSTPLGAPLTPTRFSHALRKASGQYLPQGHPCPGPHGIRHGYITDRLDQGAPVKAVSRYVGHASTSFTLDRYQTVADDGAQLAALTSAALDGPTYLPTYELVSTPL